MKVKMIRIALNMTQQQFATALGVSMSIVSKWEREAFKPSPLAMEAIEKLRKKHTMKEVRDGV